MPKMLAEFVLFLCRHQASAPHFLRGRRLASLKCRDEGVRSTSLVKQV